MATLKCDLCDVHEATFLVGVIQTGDQTGVCASCWPAFAGAVNDMVAQLDAQSQTAPEPPQTAPQGDVAAWESDYPQPAVSAARGRKSGKNGTTPEAAETAPAAADDE